MDKNWITEGLMDAEYKQYLLLAWLQKVKKEFKNTRLYPALAQLIIQQQELYQLSERRSMLNEGSGDLKSLDFRKMRLVYEHINENPELNDYLDALLEFSMPKIEEVILEGKSLYDWADEHLAFDMVGVMPLYCDEGYLMVFEEHVKEVSLFRYNVGKIHLGDEDHRVLQTTFIERKKKKLSETFEQIKLNLSKRFQELPNPATFLIQTSMAIPFEETLMPVAKRRLLVELTKDL